MIDYLIKGCSVVWSYLSSKHTKRANEINVRHWNRKILFDVHESATNLIADVSGNEKLSDADKEKSTKEILANFRRDFDKFFIVFVTCEVKKKNINTFIEKASKVNYFFSNGQDMIWGNKIEKFINQEGGKDESSKLIIFLHMLVKIRQIAVKYRNPSHGNDELLRKNIVAMKYHTFITSDECSKLLRNYVNSVKLQLL